MLPRKLHLEEINRFHDEMERINSAIETETDQDIKFKLLEKWYKMSKLWNKIDDFIEMEVKNFLDINK
jgi:hypothetical protein